MTQSYAPLEDKPGQENITATEILVPVRTGKFRRGGLWSRRKSDGKELPFCNGLGSPM
jgi:hypothetical protein